ncbi:MAG: tyrosine decarboxylase MfnA [Candidatus Altiarchaeota archaeon]|nr:tyrosine decarboxylase MfnA [Candidatus Altiarchaeota archaeon]
MDKKHILERLNRLRGQDPFFGGGRIISSVSTQPSETALDAYRIFSDVNALDTHIFESVQVLEKEAIEWLGSLMHNPKAAGYLTSGGTEANIAALYAAKKRHPGKKEIIVPKSAHYSIYKAADLMDLKIVETGIDGRYRADEESIKEALNDKTIAVVATAGTSALGAIDPVGVISELCDNVFLHVDAAFGGFMIPFLERDPVDFSLPNVDSITIDPHKMGAAPIPSGAILFRDETYTVGLAHKPPYLPVDTCTLPGSRSGGAIAATWATLMLHGRDGYEKMVKGCMENTAFLCRKIKGIPAATLVTEPELNIVGIRMPGIERIERTLREKGWKTALNRELGCMKFVVMPHVAKEVIREFTEDLSGILKRGE